MAAFPTLTVANTKKMKVTEIKTAMKIRGLGTEGNKQNLITRIREECNRNWNKKVIDKFMISGYLRQVKLTNNIPLPIICIISDFYPCYSLYGISHNQNADGLFGNTDDYNQTPDEYTKLITLSMLYDNINPFSICSDKKSILFSTLNHSLYEATQKGIKFIKTERFYKNCTDPSTKQLILSNGGGSRCRFVADNGNKLIFANGTVGFDILHFNLTLLPSFQRVLFGNGRGRILQISCAEFYCLFLMENGQIFINGMTIKKGVTLKLNDPILLELDFGKLPKIKRIQTGKHHSLLLDEFGNLWEYGNRQNGRGGLGPLRFRRLRYYDNKKVISFDTTEWISCIIVEGGVCFLDQDIGRLGVPTEIQCEQRFKSLRVRKCALSGYYEYGVVLTEDGDLYQIVEFGSLDSLTLEKIEYDVIGIKDENEVIVDVFVQKNSTVVVTSNYDRTYHHGMQKKKEKIKKKGKKRKCSLMDRFTTISSKYLRNNNSQKVSIC